MDKPLITWKICLHNIRKWPSNPRIWVLIILITIFIKTYEDSIIIFSKSVHYPISPWIFPFLFSNIYILLMIMAGLIILFCDAPFLDEEQPYYIFRSGRRCWIYGQILYLIIGSAIYFIFILLISSLMLLPNLTMTMGWGKIIGTLSQTNAGAQFGIKLQFPYKIISLYTPLNAILINFVFCWLVGIFLGMIILSINLRFSRALGCIVATGVIFFHVLCINGTRFLFYLSPVSWASLNIVNKTNNSMMPSPLYALICLIVINSLLVITSVISLDKKNIDILPPI